MARFSNLIDQSSIASVTRRRRNSEENKTKEIQVKRDKVTIGHVALSEEKKKDYLSPDDAKRIANMAVGKNKNEKGIISRT